MEIHLDYQRAQLPFIHFSTSLNVYELQGLQEHIGHILWSDSADIYNAMYTHDDTPGRSWMTMSDIVRRSDQSLSNIVLAISFDPVHESAERQVTLHI